MFLVTYKIPWKWIFAFDSLDVSLWQCNFQSFLFIFRFKSYGGILAFNFFLPFLVLLLLLGIQCLNSARQFWILQSEIVIKLKKNSNNNEFHFGIVKKNFLICIVRYSNGTFELTSWIYFYEWDLVLLLLKEKKLNANISEM